MKRLHDEGFLRSMVCVKKAEGSCFSSGREKQAIDRDNTRNPAREICLVKRLSPAS